MVKEKVGIISDVHNYFQAYGDAFRRFQDEGIKKVILNGDICDSQRTLKDSQEMYARIFSFLSQTGMEVMVQPGSHETYGSYKPVIDHFSSKYSNLIDLLETDKVKIGGSDVLFIPGSDWNAGGEFYFQVSDDLETGTYIKTSKGLVPANYGFYFDLHVNSKDHRDFMDEFKPIEGFLSYKNPKDIIKHVNDSEKTVVVCHVPRRFDNLETGVDMAHFHEQRAYHRDFRNDFNNFTYTEISVVPGVIPRKQIEAQGIKTFGFGVSDDEILDEAVSLMEKEAQEKVMISVERKANRGNVGLRDLYSELGITKAVSGHFHESSHRATDNQGNPLVQGEFHNELFWNSGCLDNSKYGIITFDENKISYQNINL
ncbi:hypothetical protein C0585_04825 [Candidatus Woesearchaeota archaeon]|nr:MAG: hypothetical protein C0585_04825 [Candidatus Woesearchaeota archaeon]